jgi:hypothetical protein
MAIDTVSYTMRVPVDLKRQLEFAAKSVGVSVASLIVDACWRHLERGEDSDTLAILRSDEGSRPLCLCDYEDWFIVQAVRRSERNTIDGSASKAVAVLDTRSEPGPLSPLAVVVPPVTYNMDALRAIAAGNIGKGVVESTIDPCALGIQAAFAIGFDPCVPGTDDAASAMCINNGRITREAYGVSSALSDVPDPCSHVEFCEDDGESYHCALIDGHKGKCKRGEMI